MQTFDLMIMATAAASPGGLAHIHHGNDGPLEDSYLVRFDCNLSRDHQRADFYRAWNYRFPESVYFSRSFRLTDEMKADALELMSAVDEDTQWLE